MSDSIYHVSVISTRTDFVCKNSIKTYWAKLAELAPLSDEAIWIEKKNAALKECDSENLRLQSLNQRTQMIEVCQSAL